ncbi:MAG: zinc ribbon domain-containing protein [Minisyncoccia bacterium]
MIYCGLCGSGVCAEEKFKKLASGKTVRYVYYGCNRSKDRFCKCGYIREEELIKDLMSQIDNLDVNISEVKKKFQKEYDRSSMFQKKFMGIKNDKIETTDLDIKSYVKHVLTEG